jgi:3-hydroxy-9,10-secoandrosta-1,3,5(10)-triene-9,17-dione monooxygenase reductase component
MTTVNGAEFRRLMGFWATGVSVITAQGSDGPAGGTANALTSLSLAPPLALACFDLSSRTLHAVRESERFCINMLASGQETISRLFATKRTQEEKFAAVAYRLEHGAPIIDGSLGWIVCRLDSELRRGDHVIVVGEVIAGGVDESALPLVFYRGSYQPLPAEREASADG